MNATETVYVEGLEKDGDLLRKEVTYLKEQLEWLKPLYDEMLQTVLKTGNIFIDESPVAMLAPGKGKTQQAYMWVVVANDLCVFDFRENRKHVNAREIMEGYKCIKESEEEGFEPPVACTTSVFKSEVLPQLSTSDSNQQ